MHKGQNISDVPKYYNSHLLWPFLGVKKNIKFNSDVLNFSNMSFNRIISEGLDLICLPEDVDKVIVNESKNHQVLFYSTLSDSSKIYYNFFSSPLLQYKTQRHSSAIENFKNGWVSFLDFKSEKVIDFYTISNRLIVLTDTLGGGAELVFKIYYYEFEDYKEDASIKFNKINSQLVFIEDKLDSQKRTEVFFFEGKRGLRLLLSGFKKFSFYEINYDYSDLDSYGVPLILSTPAILNNSTVTLCRLNIRAKRGKFLKKAKLIKSDLLVFDKRDNKFYAFWSSSSERKKIMDFKDITATVVGKNVNKLKTGFKKILNVQSQCPTAFARVIDNYGSISSLLTIDQNGEKVSTQNVVVSLEKEMIRGVATHVSKKHIINGSSIAWLKGEVEDVIYIRNIALVFKCVTKNIYLLHPNLLFESWIESNTKPSTYVDIDS